MDDLSGGDKVINYSLGGKKRGFSKVEKRYYKSVFREIDELTGITFVKTKRREANIRIIPIEDITDDTRLELFDHDHDHSVTTEYLPVSSEDAVMGRASPYTDKVKLFIKDNDSIVTSVEKYVILHEIGHSLGLGHPDGNGSNPEFTSEDTVMSYNLQDSWFFGDQYYTELDQQALTQLWGINDTSM